MSKLQITAGQVRTGDILSNGDTVDDFDIVEDVVYVYGINDDYSYERDDNLTVETDYLIRDTDEYDPDSFEDVGFEDSDNIVESVGDLLDY